MTKPDIELFVESFKDAGIASFTDAGLRALFEYMEDYDGGEGEEYMPHDLAEMLSEHATALDAALAIGYTPPEASGRACDNAAEDDALDWLKITAKTVIEFDNGIIIYNPGSLNEPNQ
jgi:hypothetical protein